MITIKSIYKLYPNVVSMVADEAFDQDGNKVEIDLALVNAWVDPEQYKYDRAKEYPSIVDQLDTLYHGGYDAWKASIDVIKNKYPKGAA
jgi:hypothetical protein